MGRGAAARVTRPRTCGRSRSCSSAPASRPTACGRSAPRPAWSTTCRRASWPTGPRAGTLKELSGIGDATARCVTESLAGEVPEYLRKLLEASRTSRSTPAVAAVRAGAARGLPHALGLVRRRVADPRDGRCRARPRPRLRRPHRPLAAADRRQRAVGGAAGTPARRRRRAQRRVRRRRWGAVPHPHRHRGRHPRRRHARPEAVAARAAGRRGGQRALQAADAARRR